MRTAEEILNENDEVAYISNAYISCMKQYAKEAIEELLKRIDGYVDGTYFIEMKANQLINELK